MCQKWLKCSFILAVLLISMVSISMATCPWFIRNELYNAQCGVLKEVPASAGLLANDPGAVAVLNPEAITIDPKYGTLNVNADGSFVYNPSPNIQSGTYVQFNYMATNGVCEARYPGIAKIQVSCTCRGVAPDLAFYGVTTVTAADLIAKDAGCMGCGDTTPKFDLSLIGTEIGVAYPYTVACPNCGKVTGHVTFLYDCTQMVCEDNNPCTDDICDPAIGCVNDVKDDGTSCDDGNMCNGVSTCQEGACTETTEPVTCSASDVCHDVGTCEPSTGVCSDPAKDDGTSCDDGNMCNGVSTCQEGACTETTEPVACSASDVCHDVGTCEPSTGVCSDPAKDDGTSCDDGNMCNGVSTCQEGACTETTEPVTCDAPGECQNPGVCDPEDGICDYSPNTGDTCDDGNACTKNDVCVDGSCTPGAAISCDDGNVCTDDSCDPDTGCQYTYNTAPCNDGVACTTGDVCSDGTCAGTPDNSKCNDGISCTDDVCDPYAGCVHDPDDSKCPSDGNVCTDDVCNPSVGCVNENLPVGTDCYYTGLCVSAATCQLDSGVAYCTPSSGARDLCQDMGYHENYKCCAASNNCQSNCGNKCISHNACTT